MITSIQKVTQMGLPILFEKELTFINERINELTIFKNYYDCLTNSK